MKRLDRKARALLLRCFTEGVGVNGTARMADVSKNTVLRFLADLGPVCRAYQDKAFRNLTCKRFEVDEVWSFCYAKNKNLSAKLRGTWGFGDCWTWTSICADCKLVPAWLLAPRDGEAANAFVQDLAGRLANKIQLTSDGHRVYAEAVERSFGAAVDYAMLIKLFGESYGESNAERKYSPAECCGTREIVLTGDPDPRHISTSYAERLNLEIRCKNRRYARLGTGFSRKVQNLDHSLSVGFMVYNFVKPHGTTRVSPAMGAHVTDHLWSYDEVVALLEAVEPNAVEVGKRRKDRRDKESTI